MHTFTFVHWIVTMAKTSNNNHSRYSDPTHTTENTLTFTNMLKRQFLDAKCQHLQFFSLQTQYNLFLLMSVDDFPFPDPCIQTYVSILILIRLHKSQQSEQRSRYSFSLTRFWLRSNLGLCGFLEISLKTTKIHGN